MTPDNADAIRNTGAMDILSRDDAPTGLSPLPGEYHANNRDVHAGIYTQGLPDIAAFAPEAVTLAEAGVDAQAEDDPRTAIANFRAALALEPFFVQARLNLAIALYVEGRYLEAEAEWRQLQSLPEERGVSRQVQRMVAASLGDMYLDTAERTELPKARGYYLTLSDLEHKKAVELSDSDQPGVIADWAATAFLADDMDRARELWKRAAAADPEGRILVHKLSKRPYLRTLMG